MLIFINWRSSLVYLVSPLPLIKNLFFAFSNINILQAPLIHYAGLIWGSHLGRNLAAPHDQQQVTYFCSQPAVKARWRMEMETMWSAGRTRGVNGLGEELWNNSCSMGRGLVRRGCKTWIKRAGAGDSKDAWAGCNHDCFEVDSGSESGKALGRSKINGKGRKVELIISVPSSRIYQFATLHSNRISMWELMSPEQWTEAESSTEVQGEREVGRCEGNRSSIQGWDVSNARRRTSDLWPRTRSLELGQMYTQVSGFLSVTLRQKQTKEVVHTLRR